MLEVTFEESSHSYADRNGSSLPSVTRIIKEVFQTGSFGHSDDARMRGEAVHRACQLISEGRFKPEQAHSTIEPYAQAWARYVSECGFKSEFWEQPLASAYGFAGKPDTFGRLAGGHRAVLDCKSGSRPVWVLLQLAAYEMLIQENFPDVGPLKKRAVQLLSDGTYKVHTGVTVPGHGFVQFDDPRCRDWFVSALNIHRSGIFKVSSENAA